MLEKIKNFVSRTDRFLFKKFGSDKSIKFLQNIKGTKTLFLSLNEIGSGDKVRFVGGCVRKSLSGENVDDIDLATILTPEEVKKRLTQKNIQVYDTGISHGTVTAVLNKKKFEITTLRKDILTDGRHAQVQFTQDWEQDASRRDFTINAIYADIDGRIFDPLDGMTDLKNGNVKFIGSPTERIQEDFLRILRYLRFFTQYSKNDHDHDVIKSIKQNINGLNKISNERIFDELIKILSLKNFYNLFSNDQCKEIFNNIFPQFKYYERLNKFKKLNDKLKIKYDKYLILALLIIDQTNDHEYFCHKYKTSNSIKKRFKNISDNFENLKDKKFYSKENIKKLIYFSGKNEVMDLLLFLLCANNKVKHQTIEELIDYLGVCEVPKFPISGDYLKKHGYDTGQALGKKLKLIEEKWINNNFVLDKKILEKSLKTNQD